MTETNRQYGSECITVGPGPTQNSGMGALNFAYWLQGFFEVGNPSTLDATQIAIIKDHLALVFNKVTPNRNEDKQGGYIIHMKGPDLNLPVDTGTALNTDIPFNSTSSFVVNFNRDDDGGWPMGSC